MDCPHLSGITKISNPFIKEGLELKTLQCSVCRSKRNLWMCIHCGILNCGRDVKGHAAEHYLEREHIISIDCHQMSIYCYICDDFVVNEDNYKYFKRLRRILQSTHKKKIAVLAVPSEYEPENENDNTLSSKNKKMMKAQCKLKASGLRNLGNTCFMNAVVQSLCNIDLFRYYFTQLPSLENIPQLRNQSPKNIITIDVLVAEELRKTIVLLLEGTKSAISPSSLYGVMWKIVPRFRGYHQQDAHEFLRYMLDRLATELVAICPTSNGNGSGSIINGGGFSSLSPNRAAKVMNGMNANMVHRIFGGTLQNEVRCLICGTESIKLDPFFDLSLDIPQRYCQEGAVPTSLDVCQLTECLNKFTELEELAETELYNCPNCKQKQKSTKKFWIRRLPNVLCLHLKRFKYTNTYRSKLDMHVEFPIKDLDMSNFILNNMHETRNSNCGNSKSTLYDLAAVIVHHGNGIASGHYTSYATHDNCWHHFNDSTVTACSEDTVQKSHAYILFYIRREEVAI